MKESIWENTKKNHDDSMKFEKTMETLKKVKDD